MTSEYHTVGLTRLATRRHDGAALLSAQSVVGTMRISFEYDPLSDIHIAYPCCRLAVPEDLPLFKRAYANYFEPLGERVDAVFVLEMFSVAPNVADAFIEGRRFVLDTFTRHSVRVATDAHASIHIAAGARNGTPHTYAPDVPTAIALIQQWRAAGYTHRR